MTQSGNESGEARAALDETTAYGRAAAGRIPESAPWYEAMWLGAIGGLVISMVLPIPFNVLSIALVTFGLGRIMTAYQERYGVWVSGYRAGRTRTIAVLLAVFVCTVMLTVFYLRQAHGLIWPGFVGAAVTVVAGFVGGRVWMRAYRKSVSAE